MPTKANSDHLLSRIAISVRDLTPTSRAEIARKLDVSPSTVSRVVDQLLDLGVVAEMGRSQSLKAGRPSNLLQINPDIATLIAVDLRLTEAYAALINLGGQILASAVEPLAVGDTRRSIDQLTSLLHHQIVPPPGSAPPRAIVIGAPSIVNPALGMIEWAPSLGWKDLPLGEMVEAEFNLPVRVENDVNLAALGEYWKGAARGASNLVFVSVGTGIGAGVVLGGELYYGATHAAGEVGYFITDIETLRHAAGPIGNLEMRAGRLGILRRSELVAHRYPASRLAELINQKGSQARVQDIFTLATEGDPAAQVVFSETVDLLTIVICNLSVMLDPEVIVLGGPSDWQWETLVDAIQKRVGAALLHPINLIPSALGQDAVVIGAAYVAIRLPGVLPLTPTSAE
ncbi:MAG TPA: ROK family transcriptional regulator [Anaerolineales bacterium]|nr:ROK family transcriptional regulator [Anaerolineales bacterium]